MAILVLMFGCRNRDTHVVVCSTIHGAHEANPNYSYDDLFAFIEAYDPDVIGVEIRPEDMDSSIAFLDQYYPYEMFACLERYPTKVVVGIDWLGKELEEKPITQNTWKEVMEIKQLQGQLANDSMMQVKLTFVDSLARQKEEIVLTASLQELNDGRYDSLNELYYSELRKQLHSTHYEKLSDFYTMRDSMITQNIVHTIEQHPGKKLLFLVGADHRSSALQTVRETFGDEIPLNLPLQ